MALTAGVTLTRLSGQEERLHGFTHAAVVPYTAILATASSTTAVVAIADVAAGDVVYEAGYKLTTAFDFSDTGITSMTLQVGDGSDTDRFLGTSGTELAVDGTEIIYWRAPAGVAATPTCPYAYNTTDTVDALFTVANGGTPLASEVTSGSVTIYLRIASLVNL